MSGIRPRKRVLHITFNMGFGGTEQVIRQLVSNLPEQHYENQILCIDGQVGTIGDLVREAGIEVFALNRRAGLDRELIRAIRHEVRQRKIDLIHCHQYTPWVYGWFARWGTGAKLVFTEHGRFHPDHYRYKAALINPLMALTTDSIVAISGATREALARYEFIPSGRIRVIYNGIRGLERDSVAAKATRQELKIPGSARIIGTVARLDPVKNQSMMLEAFSNVLQSHPDVWLLIVGDGPERETLEHRAEALGVSHQTVFTGFQQVPEKYLNVMDLFLLSSHTEGTSMTLLEAMSMGIPAVVTKVGGNGEIVEEGKTGFLTEKNSNAAFSQRILHYLNLDEKDSICMEEHCLKRYQERFSVTTMSDCYAACYQGLVRR